MILTRLHSYATTIGTQLSALLVPLQNKFEWHISNTRPDQYPFRLEAIPNATEKIINVINITHSKAKKCLENTQPSNKLHDLEWFGLPEAAVRIGPYHPHNILTTDFTQTLRQHNEQRTVIPQA
jgi:hypothetical protein